MHRFEPPARPASELVDRVRGVIETARADAERERRLPAPLLDVLRAEGAFRLFTPVELGGWELPLGDAVRILEAFGRIDGAVAWNVWNANLAFVAALLDEDGVDAIWGDGPDVVLANSARVTGTARPVDGGYRLTGRWDLVSALDSSDWVGVFAVVVEANGPRMIGPMPDVRVLFARTSAIAILDTWHTSGMRGTGSNSVVIEDLFVPHSLAPSPMSRPRIDRALYRIPPFTLASTGGAGVLLGLARAAIEAAIEVATRTSSDGGLLAGRSHLQTAVGVADAALRAAAAGLYAAIAAIDDAAQRGDEISASMRAALRSSMVHSANTARDVAASMYRICSSSAVYCNARIEQIFRDVHVAAQHGLLAETVAELSGRVLLGLDPGAPMF